MKRNKLIAAAAMLTAAIFIFTACSPLNSEPCSASVRPVLTVTGDVENELSLQDYGIYDSAQKQYNDKDIPSLQLLSVLQDAVPLGSGISLFFSSPDGVMAQIPLSEIDEGCVLMLTDENGWVFRSEKHPKQSGIKNMDKIVVCAQEPAGMQKCFRVIYGQDYITRTYGQLFIEDAFVYSILEGEAKMNESTTNAYTRRQLIPLSVYSEELGAQQQSNAIAYFADGSWQEIDLDGYLEWRGSSADYIGADKKTREADIIGVWLDAPGLAITDIASTALGKAAEGNVLIIELDGAGYYNLQELAPEFLNGKEIYAMRTVMPSISNVSLAAIVTGHMPKVNGVTQRKARELMIDDMFVAAADMGLKCAVVEGSTVLVDLSVEQTLNPDIDSSGDTDSEVHSAALKKIDEGYQFIFVHYHGYDDVAHTYGPFSNEAAQKLAVLEGYVKELCGNFNGTVIITADHGQHITDDRQKPGDHGDFIPIDMTVPFIMFEAGE